MHRYLQLLDADYERLIHISGQTYSSFKFRRIFSFRFTPVVLIRLSQYLYACGWYRISYIPACLNFIIFGLEVPPRLFIGPGLVIMHTQGTIIGASSIGSNLTIYHQVTLGAAVMDFNYTLSLRPVIGDNVTICAGSKVLGGIHLYDGCIVGANAVVLSDVPSRHRAVGVPAKILEP